MPPPTNPSPAYTRFSESMLIDYSAWKEGTPYDIAALSEITTEERDLLTGELCAKSALDWRDVEALRALATPKAIQRIGLAAEKQTDGAGIEAFMDDIAAIAAKCSAMWGNDLIICPVWPVAFLHDGYLTIIMCVNAMVSIFRFLIVFFFRKTAVIIGGPGPAKEVVLPTVEEKPDELLQDLANSVTIAQASFTWPVPSVIVYSGADKAASGV